MTFLIIMISKRVLIRRASTNIAPTVNLVDLVNLEPYKPDKPAIRLSAVSARRADRTKIGCKTE